MMIPIPAIDLKNGKVVRLLQGNFKEEKIYFEKPEIVARRFGEEGASRIHVVDLDGALKGTPKNWEGIDAILKYGRTPIQVGGGIRDLKTAEKFFDRGVNWVIIGTKACLDRGFMEEALGAFKEKIIVGIDALGGWIATDAWTKVTQIKAADFVKQVEAMGGKTIIYTDISKDGALKGPNFVEIEKICASLTIDVIASGGISCLEDLKKLIDLKQKNLTGVVIGKALYENKIHLKDAVKICLQNA